MPLKNDFHIPYDSLISLTPWFFEFPGFSNRHDIFSRSIILCLHDLPSLSHKVCFLALSGPPFVIRGIPIQWERSRLQMADLNERKNRVWGREKGDRANTELPLPTLKKHGIYFFPQWFVVSRHFVSGISLIFP